MSVGVLLAVLFAAMMHAVYHAIVKTGGDKIAAIGCIATFEVIYGAIGSMIFAPPPLAAWGWLLGAVALQTVYRLFTCYAYRLGDLSQVMPLARGTAPLLVTAGSAIWLHETLTTGQFFAIFLITAGIMTLALSRNSRGRVDLAAGGVAIASGIAVATYSIFDGVGSRITGNSGSYVWWLTLTGGFAFLIPALILRPRAMLETFRTRWYSGPLGAAFSAATYWIVVWAMTRAPIGMVSALRETAVIFAVIIGIVVLKERPGPVRLTAVTITALGIAFLKLAA